VAPLGLAVRARRRRGAGHGGAPEAWGLARARSGQSGGLGHGHHAGEGAPEGAAHGEAGERRRGATLVNNHALTRAVTTKLRARAGCSLRGEALEPRGNDGDTWTQRGDSGRAPAAQEPVR
jgi:hypothetical protein